MAFTVTVKPRSTKPSKRFPLTVQLDQDPATVGALKSAIASKVKLDVHRQRITTPDKKLLDDDAKPLGEFGVKSGDTLEIKDLGPQIGASWLSGLFLTEYFGPLFIHPAFYFGSKLFYGKTFEHSRMQKVALVLILAHYAKRELETLFVHRFSSATMPWFNIVKNSGHYWGLSGILLAAPLYGPWNGAARLIGTSRDSESWIYGWAALWAYAELSNLITHLNLASLRPKGTKVRQIPKGYGFNTISCGNYFFETIAWCAFTGLTLNWASALFTAVAVAQMYVWAVKKHRRYRKEFGSAYPRNRKAMFPFIA
uniref:BY PROTMAP: gi/472580643/gb/EMS18427.1/ enoyl reductase [Rhodosporidium toruloides NP11] gi/647397130/emb/CDR39923.1/ RHTO0S04e12068g1_1 [Rhodosporidium toruloides] n=1 Tax=Rhodotorula toruloides TaxID=5286 RepID=A0A0K3CGB4_RHOTO